RSRIEELERVLYPLQYCLSAMSRRQAIIKRYMHKCFFDDTANVSFEFQQKTMLRTAESSINLLISLTNQLDSFAQLSPNDQMTLLRSSVMQIMVVRNILITSKKPYPRQCMKRLLGGDQKKYPEEEEAAAAAAGCGPDHHYHHQDLPPALRQWQQSIESS